MELDLVDGGRDASSLQNRREVLGEVVGDSDGLCEAGGLDVFHGLPGLLVLLWGIGIERSVDEVSCIRSVNLMPTWGHVRDDSNQRELTSLRSRAVASSSWTAAQRGCH